MTETVPAEQTKRTRRPRYRKPVDVPNVQINEARDIDIFLAYEKYRVLGADQIARLFAFTDVCDKCQGTGLDLTGAKCPSCACSLCLGAKTHVRRPDGSQDCPGGPGVGRTPSPTKVIKRNGLLQAAGYLQRPPAQVEYYRAGGGSQANIHALGNPAARVIAEHRKEDAGRLNWTDKNNSMGRGYIHHRLAMADVGINFELSCRANPATTLKEYPEHLLAEFPKKTREADYPLKIKTQVSFAGDRKLEGTIPDLVYELQFPDGSKRAFLVEVDRSEMPVRRGTLNGSSLIKKCLVYEAARKSKLITRQFGWKSCRVLFAINAKKKHDRAATLAEKIMAEPQLKNSPMFLIADAADLINNNILTFPWQKPDGSTTMLIPDKYAAPLV